MKGSLHQLVRKLRLTVLEPRAKAKAKAKPKPSAPKGQVSKEDPWLSRPTSR